jgi:hypothetical protein
MIAQVISRDRWPLVCDPYISYADVGFSRKGTARFGSLAIRDSPIAERAAHWQDRRRSAPFGEDVPMPGAEQDCAAASFRPVRSLRQAEPAERPRSCAVHEGVLRPHLEGQLVERLGA